ncbi:beta-phosphoglucomutase [Bacillus oleivorans]|uniref:Beta-phosphoglucomutase n=1 Tax=Bacillus oleivorans TaxID=1448271 RepID=A0A285CHB1_9BACI|nr:beta-phosphoglucomutase [Bacillus oleivorans]SNX66889.1 beta-phosphoglucomutase [Bacillus oleivorans]
MAKDLGILIDLDGVITDTAELHYRAWKKLADSLHIPFNKAVNEGLKGLSRMDSLEALLGSQRNAFSKEEKEQMAAQKNADYRQLLEELTAEDLLPGIKAFLIDLKKRGVPIGLASASKNAPFVLEKLEIASYFDYIVDPIEVENGKPAPDIYVKGAQLLGVPPSHCIGIEDAVSGVLAVKSAGMLAIGIGEESILKEAGADLVLADTRELSWSVIKSIIESKK